MAGRHFGRAAFQRIGAAQNDPFWWTREHESSIFAQRYPAGHDRSVQSTALMQNGDLNQEGRKP